MRTVHKLKSISQNPVLSRQLVHMSRKDCFTDRATYVSTNTLYHLTPLLLWWTLGSAPSGRGLSNGPDRVGCGSDADSGGACS